MDIDPQTQYAELRSPSHNGGARLNHVGLLLKVRKCRWLLITLISLAIIVFLTAIFYKGVTLKKFQSSRYSLSRQYDMADNYNSYLALFTALFGKPIEMLVAIVLPILFITIVDKSLLATKLSSCLMIVLFIIGFLVSYLLCSAFHGINVQLRVQSATPIISLADMSLSLAGAASYAASGASALLIAAAAANASSNASVVVSETGAKNAITNTVLRNVVDLTVEPSTASPLCSNTVDYSNVLGANVPNLLSSVWTTTTTTYGFPMRSWQQEMLPGAVAESNYTLKLSDTTTTTLLNGVVLPMRLRTAANLFLHGVHVARDAFRWFGATSTPLGVQAAVDAKYGSATDGKLTHVFVSDLLGLTNTSTSNNVVDDVVSTPAFLNQVRSLFNRSLTGAANISRVESSLEFTSVSLPNGYAFESVTMEIPLVASFLSRRLTLSGNTFVEDTPDANETDIYYDLDIATDCGPYSGACEVRRTEYDASGNVFEPVTTVRALSLCNNSVGTDDLEVFFDGSVAKKNIAYTCDGQVDSGMLVVSVSSRIVGDALIEGPSTLLPRLVEGQATLKNARKIYSLTVGKLSWPKTNLATTFHAACAAGVGKCNGLQYALTAALKNSTVSVTTSGSLRGSVTTTEEDSGDNQYLVVGNDYLPLNQLSGFSYNTTEAATQTAKTTQAVSGFPLVTITKPVEADSLFENDGDVVVAANFKTVSWTQARRGASCSATVESRLNSVLNNHQYIERGVQPAYTAGMFFLFQDAVAKAQIALSLSGGASVTTLQFANTVEFVALVASIPLLSAVLTFIGCAIILLVSIYVLLMSRPKLYAIDSNGHEGDEEGTSGHVAQETLARVKLNQLLFPPVVLHRRVVDLTNSSHSTTTGTTALSPGGSKTPQSSGGYASLEGEEVDSFEVKGMQMEHENRDVSVDMAK